MIMVRSKLASKLVSNKTLQPRIKACVSAGARLQPLPQDSIQISPEPELGGAIIPH